MVVCALRREDVADSRTAGSPLPANVEAAARPLVFVSDDLSVVGQDLCGRTAEPEQNERAEDLVLDDVREQLGTADGERLKYDTGHQPGEAGFQVAEGGSNFGIAAQVEMDGVLLALVHQSGPVGLHDHPAIAAAQPVGGQGGVVLRLGPGPGDLRDAVAGQQVGAGARVQPPSVGVYGEVRFDDGAGSLRLDAVELGDGPGGTGEPGRAVGGVRQRPCRRLGFGVRRDGAALCSGQQLYGQALFEPYHEGDGGGMTGKNAVKVPRAAYERELPRLQTELVKLQEWVRAEGARLVVVFEGRDAAGEGGTIKRVAEHLNPRVARIVALPKPTERERTQWYFQRYVEHLPAAGEIVLFDRSWYNRAGVEHVMGFCTKEEHQLFLRQCPIFERMLLEDGILLRRYWFSVSDTEQQERFRRRMEDPTRRWKPSPMDLESITRRKAYSRAKDEMLVHTDIPEAPWFVVENDDKRRARLNMIAHLLSSVPYQEVPPPVLELPERPPSTGYQRPPRDLQTYVPDHAASL
ncbi:polyphosphate kinase 2 [Streptomyces sp. B4I13]|nr:polyphosphate kinase 2 [Streptomyces sp. B4I13]